MSEYLIFDIYTAQVFAVMATMILSVKLLFWLGHKFPRQADRAGECVLPLMLLLLLSFCGLQIADAERRIHHDRIQSDQ